MFDVSSVNLIFWICANFKPSLNLLFTHKYSVLEAFFFRVGIMLRGGVAVACFDQNKQIQPATTGLFERYFDNNSFVNSTPQNSLKWYTKLHL